MLLNISVIICLSFLRSGKSVGANQTPTVNGESKDSDTTKDSEKNEKPGPSKQTTDSSKKTGKEDNATSNGSPEVIDSGSEDEDAQVTEEDMQDIVFVIKDPENLDVSVSSGQKKKAASSSKKVASKTSSKDSSEDGIVYSDPEEDDSVQEVISSSSDSEVMFTRTPPTRKRKQPYPMKVRLADPPSPTRTTTEALIPRSPPSLTQPMKNLAALSPKRQVPISLSHTTQPVVYNSPTQVISVPGVSGQQAQYIVLPTSMSKPAPLSSVANQQVPNLLDAMQRLKQTYEAKLAHKVSAETLSV